MPPTPVLPRADLDVSKTKQRLLRCREITDSYPVNTQLARCGSDLQSEAAKVDPVARFAEAQKHLMHRKYAVEAQVAAYARWAEIEKKPLHERTPGEEHYVLCMEAWEKEYTPFKVHRDFEGDAALMLFNRNMFYHEEAAQALLQLEEQRRLRERTLCSPSNAKIMSDAVKQAIKLTAPSQFSPAKRRSESSPVEMGAEPPAAKRPKPLPASALRESVPAASSSSASQILVDGSIF